MPARIRSSKMDPHYNVGSSFVEMNLADALSRKGQSDAARGSPHCAGRRSPRVYSLRLGDAPGISAVRDRHGQAQRRRPSSAGRLACAEAKRPRAYTHWTAGPKPRGGEFHKRPGLCSVWLRNTGRSIRQSPRWRKSAKAAILASGVREGMIEGGAGSGVGVGSGRRKAEWVNGRGGFGAGGTAGNCTITVFPPCGSGFP